MLFRSSLELRPQQPDLRDFLATLDQGARDDLLARYPVDLEELAAINHQGETTVHNIRWVQELLGNLLMVASGIAVALPFLNKKYGFAKRWDQGSFLFVPPLFLITCFGTMFLYKLVRLVAFQTSDFTVTKYGEWPELCFAAGLMLFAYLNYRRLSAPVATPAPAVSNQAPAAK